MPNYVFDAEEDLIAGLEARLELTADQTGTSFIATNVTSATLGGIKALGSQRILVASGVTVQGQTTGIVLNGAGSGIYNEGLIKSFTATAILLSGGGTSAITNLGTIRGAKGIEVAASASGSDRLDFFNSGTLQTDGLAVLGGFGGDRIVNTGTLETLLQEPGAIAIDLKEGDDFYDGTAGTLTGIIKLGSGNDTAFGGAANETFRGGTGINIINGGAGVDAIDYSEAAGGITINLSTTYQQSTGQSYDTILNIENVIGSAFNDTLIGSSASNLLMGGDGDDLMDGGLGDDTLVGGAGNNTARFSGPYAITADLSVAGKQQISSVGYSTLAGIQNLEGGSANDSLTGDAGANRLAGNSGNDTLKGGGGNDTLEGGFGQNTAVFTGALADHTIVKNADGTVTITDNVGQGGTDQLKDIRFVKFADQTIALVNAAPTSLSPTGASIAESAALGATVANFYAIDPNSDALTYSLVSNPGGFFAVDGTKLVLARKLNYETATKHVISVKASDGWGGEITKTLTVYVGNVVETTSIVKTGTSASEQIVGEAGKDRLSGASGNDRIFGEANNDTLIGGAGNDILVGGKGKDIFIFDVKPNTRYNLDQIVDFNVYDDTIYLRQAAFSGITRKGTLLKDAFVVGDRVYDAEDRIIYLKSEGALFYDPDGTGPARAIQFASIGAKLGLTAYDFYVY